MNAADLHIGRVVLRGPAPAVEHARATLPAALGRAHWPADEAIVVVRRLAVGGTAAELPARTTAAADHLARHAADPWSPAADSADAVRFRDALDYRACLVHDLLKGTAARRWLWRHRAALLVRPAAQALAELLAEDALALPALLERPALRDSLPALWRTLDAPAAHEILAAIGRATGWQGAIAAALAPTSNERRAEKRSAFRRMSQSESTTAAPHLAHAAAQWPNAAFGSSALRFVLSNDLPPSDPRVVLQAVLTLWTHAPATLAIGAAGGALRAAAETLARPAPDSINPATQYMMAAGQGGSSLPFKGRAGVGMGQADVTETHPPPNLPLEGGGTRGPSRHHLHLLDSEVDDHAGDSSVNSPPDAASHRVSSVAASPATFPPAAEHDFRTRGGGFFFLLNVLNLPALRDWRATLAEPHSGWRELVRLARRLAFIPDAPLAAFLADACALAPNDTPVDDPAAALAALPPGADPAPVRHAALRHYGEAALAAALAERPARVRATRSHVDVHLRLSDTHRDVHLDIRRTGLDLDPGWLPWLGRVVRFHYD